MRSKIRLNEQSGRTVAEVFDDFVFAQTAEGLSEVTIRNYKLHQSKWRGVFTSLHHFYTFLVIFQGTPAFSLLLAPVKES